jgi:DNA-binding transcriptional ArsR family regulator
MTMSELAAVSDLLQLVGEPTRLRLLALLARHELTVAELTEVTELGQSRVSTHLGRLREAGLLRDRKEGASTFYALAEAPPPAARAVWELAAARTGSDPTLASDRARAEALLRRRDQDWEGRVAGEMERHYSPGRTWESLGRGLSGLLDLGDVLDAGSGDGAVAELVAPRAQGLVCIDRNPRVVAAARDRLARHRNATVQEGDVTALPFGAAAFDLVLLWNVLTQVDQPARALAECARVLRPGGRLSIVTLDAHAHAAAVAPYGHVHPGFAVPMLKKMLARAGLAVKECSVTSRERRPPGFRVVTALAQMEPR